MNEAAASIESEKTTCKRGAAHLRNAAETAEKLGQFCWRESAPATFLSARRAFGFSRLFRAYA
jgi:hypothetical protein